MPTRKIAVLPGDGIGAEVTPEAVKVLMVVSREVGAAFEFEEAIVGGAALDATGEPLPAATRALCAESDAILFGAVGGPKWDSAPRAKRPERGLLALRKDFDLYANLRPASCFPITILMSPNSGGLSSSIRRASSCAASWPFCCSRWSGSRRRSANSSLFWIGRPMICSRAPSWDFFI